MNRHRLTLTLAALLGAASVGGCAAGDDDVGGSFSADRGISTASTKPVTPQGDAADDATVPKASASQTPFSTSGGAGGIASDELPADLRASLLLFGQLEEDRVYAASFRDANQAGRSSMFSYDRRSEVIGAPLALLRVGKYWLVTTSNQREVVVLRSDLTTAGSFDPLASVVLTGGAVRYGTPVVVGRHVVLPIAHDSRLSVVRLDVPAMRISATRTFLDRFAGYPAACFVPSRGVALVSTGRLDFIDAEKLQRQRTVKIDGAPVAAACHATHVDVFDAVKPEVHRVDARSLAVGAARIWSGSSAYGALAMGDDSLAIDAESGVLASCSERSCRTSQRLGSRPTSLAALSGRYVLVAFESERRVVAIDRVTLRVVASLSTPSMPRGVAVVPPV